MRKAIVRLEYTLNRTYVTVKTIVTQKLRADGHLVAVLLVMAAVAGVCAIFNQDVKEWFTDYFSVYRDKTQQIYSNM